MVGGNARSGSPHRSRAPLPRGGRAARRLRAHALNWTPSSSIPVDHYWRASDYPGNGPWQDWKGMVLAQKGATASPAHVRASNGIWGWNQQGYVPGLADPTIVSGLDYRVDARNAESPDATQTIQPTQTVLYVRQTVEDWTATAADNQAILSGSTDLFAFRWDTNPATGLQLYMHVDGVWGQQLSNVNFPAGGQVDGQAFWMRLIFDGENGTNGGANLLQLDYSVDQVSSPASVTTWTNFDYAGTFTAPGHDCWDGSAATNNVMIGRDSNQAIGDPATDNIITHYVALYHGGIDYNATPACGVDLQSAPPSDGLYTGINGETWTSWWALDPSDGDYNASGVGSDDPLVLDHTGTDYLYLSGTTDNYASTPDSASISALSDFEIEVDVDFDDYTPAAHQFLFGQYETTGNQRSWYFQLRTSGYVALVTSTDGITGVENTCNADPSFTNGTRYNLKVTRDATTGDINYYKKLPSESSWTQIGTAVSGSTGALHDSTNDLKVGAGLTSPAGSGRLYEAVLRGAINGAAIADFNVDRDYDGGDQFGWTSSTTGEIWTINHSSSGATATIVDRPTFQYDGGDYHKYTPPSWFGADAQDLTIAVAFKSFAQPGGTAPLFDNSPVAGHFIRVSLDAATNAVVAIENDGTGQQTQTVANVPVHDGDVHVAVLRRDAGTLWKLSVDGADNGEPDDQDTDTHGAITQTTSYLGALDNLAAFFTGEIVAHAVADVHLTDAQVNQLCDTLRRGAYDDLALDLQADQWDGSQQWKPSAGQPWAQLGASDEDWAYLSGSYLYVPEGSGAEGAYAADQADFDITGDFEFGVRFAPDDLYPASSRDIIARDDGGSNRSWYGRIQSGTGNVQFSVRIGAATYNFASASNSLDDLGFAVGVPGWLKFRFVANEGGNAVGYLFYSLDDTNDYTAVSWTAAPVPSGTFTTTGNVDASAAELEVGRGGGGSFGGKYYAAFLLDDIDGAAIANPDFTVPSAGTLGFDDAQGNWWNVDQVGGSDDPLALTWNATDGDYVYMPPVTGHYLAHKDCGAATASQTVELVACADSFRNGGPTTYSTPFCVGASSTHPIVLAYIRNSDGAPYIFWDDSNGTEVNTGTSTIPAIPTSAHWLKVVCSFVDETIKVWYSDDAIGTNPGAVTWTYLGETDESGKGLTAPMTFTAGSGFLSFGCITYTSGSGQLNAKFYYGHCKLDGELYGPTLVPATAETDFDTITRPTGATDARLAVVTADTWLFDGGDRFQFTPPTWVGDAGQDFTIAVVVRCHTHPTGGGYLWELGEASHGIQFYYDGSVAGRIWATTVGATTIYPTVTDASVFDGDLHVLIYRRTYGSDIDVFIDSSATVGNLTDTVGALNTFTSGAVGSRIGGATALNGEIPALRFYRSALTDTEIDSVCTELIARYS